MVGGVSVILIVVVAVTGAGGGGGGGGFQQRTGNFFGRTIGGGGGVTSEIVTCALNVPALFGVVKERGVDLEVYLAAWEALKKTDAAMAKRAGVR